MPPPVPPGLAPTPPRVYASTPGTVITVAFGINDGVDELTSGPRPISVTKMVVNTGSGPVAGGCEAAETVRVKQFFAATGQAGYAPAEHGLGGEPPPIVITQVLGASTIGPAGGA